MRLLHTADAAVLPSHYEPFGIVALEAAATGTPLVTSNVGGLGEAVINGQTGMSFAPRDVAGLAAAVRAVLDDPAAAQRRAVAARERLTSDFDWHTVAEETAQVYLAAKRARARTTSASADRRAGAARPLTSSARRPSPQPARHPRADETPVVGEAISTAGASSGQVADHTGSGCGPSIGAPAPRIRRAEKQRQIHAVAGAQRRARRRPIEPVHRSATPVAPPPIGKPFRGSAEHSSGHRLRCHPRADLRERSQCAQAATPWD